MCPSIPGGVLSCGVDEAGRGPVIGPLVVSIVCGYDSELRDIGARDSKSLTRHSRERIFGTIKERSTFHAITIITAEELNGLMSRINLNQIEEDAYASLIERASGDCTIYVDSFDVNAERLTRKLSERTGKRVHCEHKADSIYPAVSAASILSKVTRDREIEKLEKEYGQIGSGYPSDPFTVRFLKRSFEEGRDISHIARTHWKTYRNIFGDGRTGRLF